MKTKCMSCGGSMKKMQLGGIAKIIKKTVKKITKPRPKTPKAKSGMTMKKYGVGGEGGSSMYGGIGRLTGNMTPAGTTNTTTSTPIKKAKARYGMTVKRKK